jgi:phosphatidylglycerophosphate synthase
VAEGGAIRALSLTGESPHAALLLRVVPGYDLAILKLIFLFLISYFRCFMNSNNHSAMNGADFSQNLTVNTSFSIQTELFYANFLSLLKGKRAGDMDMMALAMKAIDMTSSAFASAPHAAWLVSARKSEAAALIAELNVLAFVSTQKYAFQPAARLSAATLSGFPGAEAETVDAIVEAANPDTGKGMIPVQGVTPVSNGQTSRMSVMPANHAPNIVLPERDLLMMMFADTCGRAHGNDEDQDMDEAEMVREAA